MPDVHPPAPSRGRAAGLTVLPAWDDLLDAAEVAHRTVEPARAGRQEPLPVDVHPDVAAALERRGITGLYAHQARTWEAIARGGHVVLTTGTASGKTVGFTLPVLDAVARDPTARALFLYPRRRSRRTRPGGSRRSGSAGCGRRSTTATRRSSGARTFAAPRTSC